MNTFEKIMNVFGKNLGYTIVLIVAVIFFAYFSDGLIPGLLTAFSALVAYICGAALYRKFKEEFAHKTPLRPSHPELPIGSGRRPG